MSNKLLCHHPEKDFVIMAFLLSLVLYDVVSTAPRTALCVLKLLIVLFVSRVLTYTSTTKSGLSAKKKASSLNTNFWRTMTYKLAPSHVKNLEMMSLFLSEFLCVILPKWTGVVFYVKPEEKMVNRVP